MFLNSNFVFRNIKGTYKISDKNSIISPHFEPVYEHGKIEIVTYSSDFSDSIALSFANIDVNNEEALLNFVNTYGLIYDIDWYTYDTNDYIFHNSSRDSFPKRIEDREIVYIGEFQYEVVKMKKIILLKEAIENEDYRTIIESLIWFCLGRFHKVDDETPVPDYETFRFNDSFIEFVYDKKYEDLFYKDEQPKCFNDYIALYLRSIEEETLTSLKCEPSHWEYEDMKHSTWQCLVSLFLRVQERTNLNDINALGNVVFSNDLSDEDIAYISGNKDYLLSLARSYISDFFNTELQFVHPELLFENGKFVPNLHISSLLEAMYVELFFKFNSNTRLKKCANPTCSNFFEITWDNSKKIYCSNRCAQVMAKRMQRERERKI